MKHIGDENCFEGLSVTIREFSGGFSEKGVRDRDFGNCF